MPRRSLAARGVLSILATFAIVTTGLGCGDDNAESELAQQNAIEEARREGAQIARQNQRIRDLERQLREQDEDEEADQVPSSGAAQPNPTPSAPSSYVANYASYSPSDPAYSYVAEVPVGGGWSEPTESHPTSGALLRTSWRGPDGTLLIIDRTPSEVPSLGGSYDAMGTVPHPTFGEMTRYNFSQSTALPDCNGRPCVDYLINDGSGGGWGVLAGGPSLAVAESIASHVAQSVRYGG